MATEVDYTKMRKGTIVSRGRSGSTRIDICPKCGRKGERVVYPFNAKTGKQITHFTHAGRIVSVAGMEFFEVKDSCSIVADGVQS